MLGLFSVGHWSIDFDNPPTGNSSPSSRRSTSGCRPATPPRATTRRCCIDSAIRKVKGKIEDKEALRAALRAADFKSVRGDFKFGKNQFPVQNYYLQLVGKGHDGRHAYKTIGTVLTNRGDAYVQDCKMQ